MSLRADERFDDGKQLRYSSIVDGCGALDDRIPPRLRPYSDEINEWQHATWYRASGILHAGRDTVEPPASFPDDPPVPAMRCARVQVPPSLGGSARVAMKAHPVRRRRIYRTAQAAVWIAASILGACFAPPLREPAAPPAEELVPVATWELLGSEIRQAAAEAEPVADGYARAALERWTERVRARTEEAFIPWATSYWTHQWLALKLAWYRTDEGADEPARIARLTDYLDAEYRSTVLDPVAREIDPSQIMDRASELYVSTLAADVEALRQRHGVARRPFQTWLGKLPAISAPPGASLQDLLETQTVTALPAYRSLTTQMHRAGADSGLTAGATGLRSIAEHTAERLATTLTVRGGGAAASLLGGVPGALLGLGVSAWDATAYEQERPALEASLRSELELALRETQWMLLSDRRQGVLAPIAHISDQLRAALPAPSLPSTDDAASPEALF
jgi:hypothetical protein